MKKFLTVTMMALVMSASLAFSAVTVFSSPAKAQTAIKLLVSEAHAEEVSAPSVVLEEAPAAVAEEAPATDVEPTSAEWTTWLAQMGSLKGASGLVLAIFVLQGLLLFGRSKFVQLSAATKYWAVSILAILVALGNELMKAPQITAMTFVQALLSGGVLAAVNVYLHQGIKQNFIK